MTLWLVGCNVCYHIVTELPVDTDCLSVYDGFVSLTNCRSMITCKIFSTIKDKPSSKYALLIRNATMFSSEKKSHLNTSLILDHMVHFHLYKINCYIIKIVQCHYTGYSIRQLKNVR